MPRGDRPPAVHRLRRAALERALGERRERQPEPRPDEHLRRDGPQPAGARQDAERGEPTGDQDRAGGGARARPTEPMGEAPRRDRGGRQHRDDHAGDRGVDAPAVDEEQDEQEERRREGAGDQQQREVRRDVRSTRPAADRVCA